MIIQAVVILLLQIVAIVALQISVEIVIDPKERPYVAKTINIAMFLATLALVFNFAATHVLPEMRQLLQFAF